MLYLAAAVSDFYIPKDQVCGYFSKCQDNNLKGWIVYHHLYCLWSPLFHRTRGVHKYLILRSSYFSPTFLHIIYNSKYYYWIDHRCVNTSSRARRACPTCNSLSYPRCWLHSSGIGFEKLSLSVLSWKRTKIFWLIKQSELLLSLINTFIYLVVIFNPKISCSYLGLASSLNKVAISEGGVNVLMVLPRQPP